MWLHFIKAELLTQSYHCKQYSIVWAYNSVEYILFVLFGEWQMGTALLLPLAFSFWGSFLCRKANMNKVVFSCNMQQTCFWTDSWVNICVVFRVFFVSYNTLLWFSLLLLWHFLTSVKSKETFTLHGHRAEPFCFGNTTKKNNILSLFSKKNG